MLTGYLETVITSITQLQSSKDAIQDYKRKLMELFKLLKDMGTNAQNTLRAETLSMINKVKKLNELKQELEGESITDQRKAAIEEEIKEIEVINKSSFSQTYHSKEFQLQKFLSRTYNNLNKINQSFESDYNSCMLLYTQINDTLLRLKQRISSGINNVMVQDQYFLHTKIINFVNGNVDKLNLIISNYNNIIDKFTDLNNSLIRYTLTYKQLKVNRMIIIEIMEFTDTIDKLSTYKNSIDSVKQIIDEYFTNLNTDNKVDFVQIQKPDITFPIMYRSHSATTEPQITQMEIDENQIIDNGVDETDIGEYTNVDYQIKLKPEDVRSNVITDRLFKRYIEVVAKITRSGFIKFNRDREHLTPFFMNIFTDNATPTNFNVLTLDIGVNDLICFKKAGIEFTENAKYLINKYDNCMFYNYTNFNMKDVLVVIYLMVSNIFSDIVYYEEIPNLTEMVKKTILDSRLYALAIRTEQRRQDVTIESKHENISFTNYKRFKRN
ncbi:KM727_gp74-like protein [Aratus pisonii nudivirus]|nr:KM727_gp74-like protein [Aratus pisonii nudivirus]